MMAKLPTGSPKHLSNLLQKRNSVFLNRPFDEVKYKALLEGLEVAELNINALESGLRIDAELYKKSYIKFEQCISKIGFTTFSQEASLIKKGIFDIKADCYSQIPKEYHL